MTLIVSLLDRYRPGLSVSAQSLKFNEPRMISDRFILMICVQCVYNEALSTASNHKFALFKLLLLLNDDFVQQIRH